MTSLLVPLTHSISPFSIQWCSTNSLFMLSSAALGRKNTRNEETPTHSHAHTIRPSLGFKYHGNFIRTSLNVKRTEPNSESSNKTELCNPAWCFVFISMLNKKCWWLLNLWPSFQCCVLFSCDIFSWEVVETNAKLLLRIRLIQEPPRVTLDPQEVE